MAVVLGDGRRFYSFSDFFALNLQLHSRFLSIVLTSRYLDKLEICIVAHAEYHAKTQPLLFKTKQGIILFVFSSPSFFFFFKAQKTASLHELPKNNLYYH